MTERLYYTEPTCVECDATVTSCHTVDGRSMVTLDRTVFYPSSGGQPCDTGTLGGCAVVDVLDLDGGQVGHVVDAPLVVGSSVRGQVDWPRRFDHMQQHTGQHILSAAFDRLHQARTVGFHLGADVSTLDLDKVLNAGAMEAAEIEANRIVWDNRPVSIRFATPEEAATMTLRKEPTRSGSLRLIDVAGFDLSACGGTHVEWTGQIGHIAVKSWEKFRGGTRLEFVCGGRALREYRMARDIVAGCVRVLSVPPADLPAAIERGQADNKDLRRTAKAQQQRLAVYEAAGLVARGTSVGSATVVVEVIEGWDQAGLKALATAAASRPGVVAALMSASEPTLVVIARASDVSLDASAVLKALVAGCGGKGGGKADLAQGGGMTGDPATLKAELESVISRALQPEL